MSKYFARQLSLQIFPFQALFQILTARTRRSLLQISVDSELMNDCQTFIFSLPRYLAELSTLDQRAHYSKINAFQIQPPHKDPFFIFITKFIDESCLNPYTTLRTESFTIGYFDRV